jgi:lipoate-protein ligase B
VTVRPARLLDLGVRDYQEAWALQLELVARRQRGEIEDALILVEHPPVITLGRARAARGNVVSAGEVPVVEIERGGDVTYHGPGQLVAYPILALDEGERDLHKLLRNLEEAIILAARDLGVGGAGREPGKTGVWVNGRKLASIGIACRRWVTFHGVALNCSTDLAQFTRINPCGFDASVMTSLTVLAGRLVSIDETKPLLARRLGETLGRDLRPQASGLPSNRP